MRQPGVEVRPIHQITGEPEFNEVFITDARVPHANLVGEPGAGWSVPQVAAYERRLMGDLARTSRSSSRDLQAGCGQPIGMACPRAGSTTPSSVRRSPAEAFMRRSTAGTPAGPRRPATGPEAATRCHWARSPCRGSCMRRPPSKTEIVGPESMLAGRTTRSETRVTFRTLNAYFTDRRRYRPRFSAISSANGVGPAQANGAPTRTPFRDRRPVLDGRRSVAHWPQDTPLTDTGRAGAD